MESSPQKENDVFVLFEVSKVDGCLKECLIVIP